MIKKMMNKSTWLTLGLVVMAVLAIEAQNESAAGEFLKSDSAAISEDENCSGFTDADAVGPATALVARHDELAQEPESATCCGRDDEGGALEVHAGPWSVVTEVEAYSPDEAIADGNGIEASAVTARLKAVAETSDSGGLAPTATIEAAAGKDGEGIEGTDTNGDAPTARAPADNEAGQSDAEVNVYTPAAESQSEEAMAGQSENAADAGEAAQPVDDDNGAAAKEVAAAPEYSLAA